MKLKTLKVMTCKSSNEKKAVIVVYELHVEMSVDSVEDLRKKITTSSELSASFTPAKIIDKNKKGLFSKEQTEIISFDALTNEPIFEGDKVYSDDGVAILAKNLPIEDLLAELPENDY